MPLVDIRLSEAITRDTAQAVRDIARGLVATHLDCDDPGGELSPEDVEARVSWRGDLDVSAYDLEIMVFANYYPARDENLDVRVQHIRDELENTFGLAHTDFFVWVFLGHAEFADHRK